MMCLLKLIYKKKSPQRTLFVLERMKGVEPSCPAWEAGILPMNYTRTDELHSRGRNIICVCIDNATFFPNFPVFLITSSKENISHDLSSFRIIFLKTRCDKVWKQFHTLFSGCLLIHFYEFFLVEMLRFRGCILTFKRQLLLGKH